MILNSSTTKRFLRGKMNKLTSLLLFFLLGHHAAPPLAAQELKPGIFYSITGKGLKDTSWLFGTYHLVNSSYLDDLPAVKKAFARSGGVVVEIIADSTELLKAQQAGMLQNQQLSNLLDAPFRDSLDAELKNTIGAGLLQLNQLKPANVSLILSVTHMIKNQSALLAKYAGLPLDAGFVAEGKQQGKTVKTLETITQQMDFLFNSSSLDEQVLALKTFIRKKSEMTALSDELIGKWFAQDLKAMWDVYEKTLQVSGEEDKLIKERNINWMKLLPQWIQQGSQFIAVGALHLGGKYGLVELLKQQGYSVVPVNTK